MCLQFGPMIDTTDRNNVFFCPENDLIRIDSQEKDKYIKEITGIFVIVHNAYHSLFTKLYISGI